MPFVTVHTSRRPDVEARRALGAGLTIAYGEHMQTTHRIVNVAFSFYEPGDVARYDAPGNTAQEMTIVTCDVRAGRSPATVEELGRAFTALCVEHLAIDPLRVAIYVNEHAAYQSIAMAAVHRTGRLTKAGPDCNESASDFSAP